MARRNNPDRLGAPQPDASGPETLDETQQVDPLSFIVPTEFVALPSKGLFYSEGHPLHNEESVEIKYMTAKEEDLLSSRSLLEKGVVLDRLIQNLLVDNKIQARDLLVADRNAILIAARSSGYGEDYTARITCGECGEADSYKYDLQHAAVKEPLTEEELKGEGIEYLGVDLFRVQVPNSPVDVIFRLFTGHDEHTLMTASNKRKKGKQNDQLVTDQLKLMLMAVMGHQEQEIIDKYVNSLPLRDSRFLRKTHEKVSPSVELSKEVVCSSCGAVDDITFPFTTQFFWPDVKL